jgi:hypothetical protein
VLGAGKAKDGREHQSSVLGVKLRTASHLRMSSNGPRISCSDS